MLSNSPKQKIAIIKLKNVIKDLEKINNLGSIFIEELWLVQNCKTEFAINEFLILGLQKVLSFTCSK